MQFVMNGRGMPKPPAGFDEQWKDSFNLYRYREDEDDGSDSNGPECSTGVWLKQGARDSAIAEQKRTLKPKRPRNV